MADLNSNLEWSQVPDDVKSAFRGVPQKAKLDPQFRLYKFTDHRLTGQGPITAWWSPVEPYGIDAGLEARLALARQLGASPGDLTRVVAAVKENWNACDHLLKAELLKGAWGFWGQCSTQQRSDSGGGITKNLPGYAWQFYIPSLTGADIRETGWTSVTK